MEKATTPKSLSSTQCILKMFCRCFFFSCLGFWGLGFGFFLGGGGFFFFLDLLPQHVKLIFERRECKESFIYLHVKEYLLV